MAARSLTSMVSWPIIIRALHPHLVSVGQTGPPEWRPRQLKLVEMCGPQHVDKNGIHNILTDARVLVFGIYVSILLLPCLWAGCLGLDVEKMMPTNEDLHSPLFYGSASLQPPPHQQKEGGM